MTNRSPQPQPIDETCSSPACILVVDDERAMRRTLRGIFEHLGYQAAEASSGREALDYLSRQSFDLVVLDLKMPEMSGIEVLEAARPLAPGTVFIILTAHGALDSAISALRLGAFDYLLKPCSVKDITRAVEAGLAERRRRLSLDNPIQLLEKALNGLKSTREQERPGPSQERFLQVGPIVVDLLKHLAAVDGQPINLSATEFDILTYMIQHRDRVISCSELATHIRGYDLDERDARILLRSHIHRLRGKVEHDPTSPHFIHVLRGRGYIFSESMPAADASPSGWNEIASDLE